MQIQPQQLFIAWLGIPDGDGAEVGVHVVQFVQWRHCCMYNFMDAVWPPFGPRRTAQLAPGWNSCPLPLSHTDRCHCRTVMFFPLSQQKCLGYPQQQKNI